MENIFTFLSANQLIFPASVVFLVFFQIFHFFLFDENHSLAFFNHFGHPLQWGIFLDFFPVKPQWGNIKFQDFDGIAGFFQSFWAPCAMGDFSRFFFLSNHNEETLSFKTLMESLAFFNHFGHPVQWGIFLDFFFCQTTMGKH